MYKILIHIDTQSGDKWFYYQENGKDYVTDSLQEIRDTVLTLIDVYGEDYIKIVKQMSGQDMDNSDVYLYDSTDNYEELDNRPSINGIEIIGQLSLEELGIQPAGDYATEEYVQKAIDGIEIPEVDFTGYATEEYVDNSIANIDIPETNLEGYATEEYVANAIEGYATTDYVDEKTKSFFIQAEKFADFDTAATVEIFNQWIQDYRSTKNLKPFVIRTKNRNDAWKWYDFRCYCLTRQSEDKVTNPIYYISFITRRYDSNTVFYTLNMRLYTDQHQVTEVSCNMDNSYIQATTLSQPSLTNYLSKTNTTEYTPDKDYNPATKKYVDDAVANIDVPDVDLSDYYNKTEIDDKLLTVDVNVEGLDIYSDEERVIGRWVDGRPLYQKYIYIGELTNGITDTHLDDYGIKAHEVRFHQVYKMGPDGILCLISPQFMSMAGQVIVRVLLYQEDSGFNVLRVATGEGMDVEGHTAYAIVTYTKPDDEILLPISDYYPATQKYVNDAVAGAAQVNHYICTASTKNPGILNFAVTHVRPTSTRLLEIIEEGFTNIANGVNEGFVLDYSPNNNSVANWNNVTIHTNYIKPSDFTQTASYELLAYTQRKAVIYLGVLKVNGTWSDNKFTCSSVEQPGAGAWTQFNFDLLLTKANTTEYTPTNDYNPATKKYVDDAVAGVSGGSGGGADLTNYYTKAEVDALLQELRNEFVSANNNINDKLETIIYGGE